jgi:hypothetical protein
MNENNPLVILKQCFEKIVPTKDSRTTINPLEFIVSLVFCYLGDSKTFSLEAIRRSMMSYLNRSMSRSAFWERLAGNRLKKYLRLVVAELMSQLTGSVVRGSDLLEQLGVTAVWLMDTSSITLCDKAEDNFPGTRTAAGIKWHGSFDLLTGLLTWFTLTPSSTHDRKCFPPLEMLTGKLVIFDLGYWDYGLLYAIENVKGFFLCRVKSNAVIYITEVVQGLSNAVIGQSLLSLNWSRKRGHIIEVLIEKVHQGNTLRCRAIGFWNPIEKGYHWYLTNLTVAACLIYPLYRLR